MNSTSDIKKTLSARLASWMNEREDLNTQVKLSQKSGVAQATIGRLLVGKVASTVDTIEAVAHAFDKSAAELLGGFDTARIKIDAAAFALLPETEIQKIEAFISFTIQQNEATKSLNLTYTKLPNAKNGLEKQTIGKKSLTMRHENNGVKNGQRDALKESNSS